MWERSRAWLAGRPGRLFAVSSSGVRGAFVVALAALGSGCAPPGDLESGASEPRLGAARAALLQPVEQAKLFPNVPVPDGSFGGALDVQGDTAVVGASSIDPLKSFVGGAYVFERSGGIWAQEALLVSPQGKIADFFAESVALDGDTIAAGQPYEIAGGGLVYTFVRTSGTWTLEAQIAPEDGLGTASFGAALALSGDTLLVGDRDGEAAYVMVRSGGVWTQQARLDVPYPMPPEGAVALSGDTAVLGTLQGALVFVRSSGAWTQEAELSVENVVSVALDGDTVVVGAHGDVCRVFTREGGVWAEEADLALLQDESFFSEYFGAMVALEGDRALVGTQALYNNYPSSGLAYTFRRQGGVWAEEAVITAPDVKSTAGFASTGALSGDTVLLGAPLDGSAAGDGGAVHAFVLVPGLPDGAACAYAAQCDSGHCTDGVCCDTLCEGTCAACTAAKKGAGKDGVCEPIIAGQDPEDECVAGAAGTCGSDGACDGSGACQLALGGACDDGDPCTDGDACAAGACAGKARVCPPPDACHLAGQCNSKTGVCDYPLKNLNVPECDAGAAPSSCGCRTAGSGEGGAWWMLALGALPFARRRRSRAAP